MREVLLMVLMTTWAWLRSRVSMNGEVEFRIRFGQGKPKASARLSGDKPAIAQEQGSGGDVALNHRRKSKCKNAAPIR